MHLFEDLQKSPTFPAVTFGMQHAFAFEVHVIGQCIAAVRRTGNASELALDVIAFSRRSFLEHFGVRLLQTGDHELGLKIDSVGQELAKFAHLGRILGAREFGA